LTHPSPFTFFFFSRLSPLTSYFSLLTFLSSSFKSSLVFGTYVSPFCANALPFNLQNLKQEALSTMAAVLKVLLHVFIVIFRK